MLHQPNLDPFSLRFFLFPVQLLKLRIDKFEKFLLVPRFESRTSVTGNIMNCYLTSEDQISTVVSAEFIPIETQRLLAVYLHYFPSYSLATSFNFSSTQATQASQEMKLLAN
jgi:hypothetical protein